MQSGVSKQVYLQFWFNSPRTCYGEWMQTKVSRFKVRNIRIPSGQALLCIQNSCNQLQAEAKKNESCSSFFTAFSNK